MTKDFVRILSDYREFSQIVKKLSYYDIILLISQELNIDTDQLENLQISNYGDQELSSYKNVLCELIKNINHYDALYKKLSDQISKSIFSKYIQNKIIPSQKSIDMFTSQFSNNDPEILKFKDQPIYDISADMLDCGTDRLYSETQKLINAKNRLKNESPALSVCISNTPEDFWCIPELIENINPYYKFYIRSYPKDQSFKIVLYAQVQQSVKINRKPKRAVAVSYSKGWRNVELTKDCGLIPYLLYKNHYMDVSMLGAQLEDYPYSEEYVKGLKIEFLSTGSNEEKISYIRENASDIDLLILRGAYIQNTDLATEYKRINPSGKIYVGLDANSAWMDRIIWNDKYFMSYMSNCDLIATSCHAMEKHLNEKWPWKIEFIPNGYYKFGYSDIIPEFKNKQNVILTVGRLGTPQKATDILLRSFALIADEIPDWTLRLVGSVNENFDGFIEDYFSEYPDLIDRIEFAGVITDKSKLYSEYAKAKIFALPSSFEGGTPNVVAEALNSGCVPAVTKFDAWEDAIDYGKCGMACEIGDVSAYADILLKLAKNEQLSMLSENAYQYSLKYFNMETIVDKLYETLFGGE